MKKKKIGLVILVLVLLYSIGGIYYNITHRDSVDNSVKSIDKIDKYGYVLKSNATNLQKELFNELKRIQAGEHKQHDLIYHETLYCQCQNDTSHIFQHRHKSVEADTCEGLGDQAEDTDRGCFHDCNRHFHHNVIELTEKVRHSGDPVAHGSQKNADK